VLPAKPAPLVREHRVYQADWLLRFYGFRVDELTTTEEPNLDMRIDPKTTWAVRHPEQFPVDINVAPREMLLRTPGLGQRSVERLLRARKQHRLSLKDLQTLRIRLSLAKPFITASDWRPVSSAVQIADQVPRQPLLWTT